MIEEEEEEGGGGRETFILWQPSVSAVAHALPSISAGENDRIICFQCTMAKGVVIPTGSQKAACCSSSGTVRLSVATVSPLYGYYCIFCCLVDEG